MNRFYKLVCRARLWIRLLQCTRSLVSPWALLSWADACDEEATFLEMAGEGLLANTHRAWALELRAVYKRWSQPAQPLSTKYLGEVEADSVEEVIENGYELQHQYHVR